MAWRNFRELLAWALFVLVTAVHLHSRTQLELCMTQLESPRTQMRAITAFPLVENGGASLPDEPNGAVVYTDPLLDAKLADATSGRTLCRRTWARSSSHATLAPARQLR